MRRLDRYIMAEILGPLGLGFLVYTFILLLRFLFQSAEMIIRRGLPVSIVGKLLILTLPNIVVLTIPMALLFGILIAVGRLASDSELIALRSSGVSLLALYRPILLLSGALTLINTLLMLYALPWGNHGLQQLRIDIVTQSVSQQVQPRVFYEEWEGKVIYVFAIPPGQNRWRGVFLAESLPSSENEITVAEWGRVRVDEKGERVILELENAYTHKVDLNHPDRYEITRHNHLEIVLQDRFTSSQREKIAATKGLRELTAGELWQKIHQPGLDRETHNLAWVELNKKFSIPAACLVFGLFALPLGFNNRRGSKASGFALSIGVIVLYYVLLNNGEEAARFGKMPPWLSMWLPNLLLGAAGVVLLARRNRDKSLLLSRFDRWVREDLWNYVLAFRGKRSARRRVRREQRRERQQLAAAGGASETPRLVVRLSRPRLRFPNLLDRYVIRIFGGVFFLVLLSGVSLYIVADLSENVEDFLKNQISRGIILSYYKYLSLQIYYDIAPIVVLVTTLIAFSLLARSNEITACKALGVSLFRLSLSALAAAGLVVVFSIFLESEILPASNQRVAQLKDRIKGRETARTYRRADRQWLFGHGRYIYNYLHYDPRDETLQRLQIFEFDDHYRLRKRLVAASARYAGGAWIFSDGWARTFDHMSDIKYERFEEPVLVDYPETPDYFDSEVRPPEQMRYGELKSYIHELIESGQRVPELKVELYNKIAFPVISLVMALVALPFAFRLGRQGALYGIGLSIVLGMVFMGIYAFFTTLGEAGALPPLVAVWSPNVVFALFSAYLFLGVRS